MDTFYAMSIGLHFLLLYVSEDGRLEIIFIMRKPSDTVIVCQNS
jgi:hypothetical protein